MRAYKICSFCVMDTSDPNIKFDSENRCNHCKSYFDKVAFEIIPINQRRKKLENLVENIKSSNIKGKYDCVVGVSGGVDSSYVALIAKDFNLRTLLVHLDNGWDSQISVQNINNITKNTGFDLFTHVIDWNEFKDLQLSLFKASVVDIELATDHAIKALLFQISVKFGIKYMLNGGNVRTEAIMPVLWRHSKPDIKNLKDIHSKYGTTRLKTYPMAGILKQQFYKYFYSIKNSR